MIEEGILNLINPILQGYQEQIDELNRKLKVKPVKCLEGTQKTIREVLGLTNVSDLCKEFRTYADSHPGTFGAYKPYYENDGEHTVYYLPAILFFKMNKTMLLSGSRSYKLNKKEVDSIIERYRL